MATRSVSRSIPIVPGSASSSSIASRTSIEQGFVIGVISRARRNPPNPLLDRPESVLAYLARYTDRVAISDQRLLELDEDHVQFRYMDYRSRRTRRLDLGLHEFARRFLLHVLPRRFVRIRYYGFLANGCRKRRIAQCLEALGAPARDPAPESDAASAIPLGVVVVGLLPTPTRLCPACCNAPMSCVQLIERPPPFLRCPHPRV